MDSSTLFGISTFAYFVAMAVYVSYIAFRKNAVAVTATAVTVLGFLCQTGALLLRWIDSFNIWAASAPSTTFIESVLRGAPLRNMYESMVFFVWCIVLIYLITEFKYKNRSLGAFVMPVVALALAFIDVSGMETDIQPLIPALQSNWLLFHVFLSFIGYAAFGVSFAAGLMYLIASSEKNNKNIMFWFVSLLIFVLYAVGYIFSIPVFMFIVSCIFFLVVDVTLNVSLAKLWLFNEKPLDFMKIILGILVVLWFIGDLAGGINIIRGISNYYSDGFFSYIIRGISDIFSGTVSSMLLVTYILFICTFFIKFVLVHEDYYLFWTGMLGIFVVVLFAMGIDYLNMPASEQGKYFQSYFLKATFRNSSGGIPIFSWLVAMGFIAALWRYGLGLRRVLESLSITKIMLEDIEYKSIAIGFPLFTIGGLLMGAIWANSAWGTYWSWDPKETWSLITWFVYAGYLHARFVGGWRGKKVSVLALIGFIGVVFTYLGVNLFLSGLHSYGGQ